MSIEPEGPRMNRATVRQCAVWLGRSTIEPRLLREFTRFGVTEFLLLASDPRLEAAAAEAGLPGHAVIRVVSGGNPADLLRQAREHLDPRFLFARADSVLDTNLARLFADSVADDPDIIGRLLLRRGQVAPRGVTLDGDRVTGVGPSALHDTGIGLFNRSWLDALPAAGSPDTDPLSALARGGVVRGTVLDPLPGSHPDAPPRLALFLDRDGVINIDHHYVGTRDRFEWVPGARETIAHATDLGWHVFIVTNQSGIARGRYSEADLRDLHAWLSDEVRTSGGTIDDIRYCPFHPDAVIAAYRAHSSWRKPAPGMLLDLIRTWALDPERCLMIGDQDTDMQAAKAAGVRRHRFPGGNLFDFARPLIDAATGRAASG